VPENDEGKRLMMGNDYSTATQLAPIMTKRHLPIVVFARGYVEGTPPDIDLALVGRRVHRLRPWRCSMLRTFHHGAQGPYELMAAYWAAAGTNDPVVTESRMTHAQVVLIYEAHAALTRGAKGDGKGVASYSRNRANRACCNQV